MSREHNKVLQRELVWHDQESYRRNHLNQILYRAPAFDAVIQSGIIFLAPQEGAWILDFGGGEGKETLQFLQQDFVVVNADLSTTQLERARKLIQSTLVEAKVYYIQADVEHLPFSRSSFRYVYGKAILHHLDIHQAAHEITRILVDEHPFTVQAWEDFVAYFAEDHTTTHFLTAPAAYVLRFFPGCEKLFRWVHRILQLLDSFLFRHFHKLQQYAWYYVVNVRKGYIGSKPDNSTAE
jgi:ubiquinone/menaquinone biosynthesis C-methylase UbiE